MAERTKMTKGTIRLVRLLLASVVLTVASAAASTNAFAIGVLDPSQFEVTSFNSVGSETRAGARTDFRNRIELKSGFIGNGVAGPEYMSYGSVSRLEIELPPGLVGDPTAYPTCSVERFLKVLDSCPEETQVGTIETETAAVSGVLPGKIYNLAPGEGQPALFGVKFGISLYSYISVKVSSDGEITAVSEEMPMTGPINWVDSTMYAVPADHTAAADPRLPFMTNPTNCTSSFASQLNAVSYEGVHSGASVAKPARIACEKIPFAPAMKVTPTSRTAGAPTGLNVDITVPQSKDPDGLATAHVKDVTMTLPEGLGLSASSATGLGSCSPGEFGYHQETPVSCPLSSKVGEVEVKTPILEKPMTGPVYVAKQNDNPFNSLIALYMAPSGSGVTIKLAGKVDLDPNTGRLTSTFLNNPQQPFERLHVRLKDGPRAPLALPRACGTYTTTADLRSWSMPGQPVPLADSFSVDQGCGREGGFTPGFSAGTVSPEAGAFSPFTMRITRSDDAQANISRLTAILPQGLLAKLAGVPLCSDPDAAAGNCPEASKVGRTTVGVGAGPDPVFAPEPGRAPTALYLGGPYNGGPYSLIAEVPAQAGPFDLGTVILRNALRVDPTTTQVTAISDPLPQFLQGVPISYRDIRVDVDRPSFTVNPTSCRASATSGSIGSSTGGAASVSDRFGVRGCRGLAFKPRLRLQLAGATKRSGNPALTAVLTQPPTENANIDAVTVVLPKSQFIDNSHINNPCTRVQFNEGACPPKSILGVARAFTPLLDKPLEGPVYFRSNGGERELPDLVADLNGPIHVTLVGFIDSVKKKGDEISRVRTRFLTVPDAPVSKFVMELAGGKRGLLENSTNLCAKKQRSVVKMDGQNGKPHDFQPVVRVKCGAKKKR